MPVYKEKSGTWRVNYRYTDWTGANKQTTKRGFATRREALTWEREQSIKLKASLDMTFGNFVDLYTADKKCRVRENTWRTKEHIIRTKILLSRQQLILPGDDVPGTDITDLPIFEERQDLRPDDVLLGAPGVLPYTAFLICRVEIYEAPERHIQ